MKKFLCVILSAVMIFSSVGVGMTASALKPIDHRPDGIYDVIAPILYGVPTSFADSIAEIGYETINDIADGNILTGYTSKDYIGIDEFDSFITANGDDEMLGVSYDFLYNKSTNAFMWTFLHYDLKRELKDDEGKPKDDVINEIIYSILGSYEVKVDGKTEFVTADTFKTAVGKTDFTIHDIEMYVAYKAGKRTACICKGKYDTAAELFAGYDYDYPEKISDKQFFDCIAENKQSVYNPWTRKNEVHYDYAYKFEKGEFGLMRANSNNQFAKVVQNIWGDGELFKTQEIASKNARIIANFIGNLINPTFSEFDINSSENLFKGQTKITKEMFFEKVTVISGLDSVLQAKWCNAQSFDVKKIMAAFGVNVKDDVIYDSELSQGDKMGKRILTDIYTDFCSDPMGYIMNLLQLFCKNYEYSYRTALEELFSVKVLSVMTQSREANIGNKYPKLEKYSGAELDTFEGFLGFIFDCIYMERVDDGGDKNAKFTLAPLPVKRITTAADINELFVYLLCYFELNRVYNGNAEFIEDFIKETVFWVETYYQSGKSTAEERKEETEFLSNAIGVILSSFLQGELTFPEIFVFHTGALSVDVLGEITGGGLLSNIQKALAKFFQKILDYMDNLRNLLFGWTDDLLGGQ